MSDAAVQEWNVGCFEPWNISNFLFILYICRYGVHVHGTWVSVLDTTPKGLGMVDHRQLASLIEGKDSSETKVPSAEIPIGRSSHRSMHRRHALSLILFGSKTLKLGRTAASESGSNHYWNPAGICGQIKGESFLSQYLITWSSFVQVVLLETAFSPTYSAGRIGVRRAGEGSLRLRWSSGNSAGTGSFSKFLIGIFLICRFFLLRLQSILRDERDGCRFAV